MFQEVPSVLEKVLSVVEKVVPPVVEISVLSDEDRVENGTVVLYLMVLSEVAAVEVTV